MHVKIFFLSTFPTLYIQYLINLYPPPLPLAAPCLLYTLSLSGSSFSPATHARFGHWPVPSKNIPSLNQIFHAFLESSNHMHERSSERASMIWKRRGKSRRPFRCKFMNDRGVRALHSLALACVLIPHLFFVLLYNPHVLSNKSCCQWLVMLILIFPKEIVNYGCKEQEMWREI